jgi:hypothetical protein
VRRKRRLPSVGGVEQELLDALERLKQGRPNDPILARKAKLGILRINATTVAKEARRARTLISHDACAYPRVRAAIIAFAVPVAESKTLADVNRRLREDNVELRRAVKIARAEAAAMLLRMERLAKDANREVKAVQRRERRGKRDPNSVAGIGLEIGSAPVTPIFRDGEGPND